MSIFDTLTIGKQGLLAQGRAIQVTSNNVANVNTPGYTRQRPVFEPVAPSFLPSGFPVGGGTDVNTIERIADAALDAQLQRERQVLSYNDALEAGLTRIEGIFEELGGTGITAALQGFFKSLNDLAVNPQETAVREGVVQAAKSLADLIRDADRRLTQLGIDQNQKVEQIAGEINTLAKNIAALNRQIFQKEAGGAVASSLRDRREELLRELGERVDFTTFERDNGQIAVFVAGGFLLVDDEVAGGLEVSTDQSVVALPNPAYLHVFQDLDGQINGPITSEITGGKLGAALQLRDIGIEGYRDSLDEFTLTLANRINAQHLAGYGLDDNVQRRLFVDPTQAPDPQGPNFAAVDGAAAFIDVNAAILSNNRHIAAGLTSVGGAGANPGDNENALLLAAIQSNSSAFYRIGDAVAGPGSGSQRTLGGYMDSLAGALGAEIQGTRLALSQSELIVAELQDRRGALSGVNLDEEVTNLIAYERAYQASARVIQIADGLLQMLLEL
jgi:flagellar hook-associated protein 1 FlgK